MFTVLGFSTLKASKISKVEHAKHLWPSAVEIGTINYFKSVGIWPFKMKSPIEDSTGILFLYLIKVKADVCYRVYLHTQIIWCTLHILSVCTLLMNSQLEYSKWILLANFHVDVKFSQVMEVLHWILCNRHTLPSFIIWFTLWCSNSENNVSLIERHCNSAL